MHENMFFSYKINVENLRLSKFAIMICKSRFSIIIIDSCFKTLIMYCLISHYA
jgi:hypothetical protein